MKAVEFVFAASFLMIEPFALLKECSGIKVKVQFFLLCSTDDLTQYSPKSVFELFECCCFSFELFGVVVAEVFGQ